MKTNLSLFSKIKTSTVIQNEHFMLGDLAQKYTDATMGICMPLLFIKENYTVAKNDMFISSYSSKINGQNIRMVGLIKHQDCNTKIALIASNHDRIYFMDVLLYEKQVQSMKNLKKIPNLLNAINTKMSK